MTLSRTTEGDREVALRVCTQVEQVTANQRGDGGHDLTRRNTHTNAPWLWVIVSEEWRFERQRARV